VPSDDETAPASPTGVTELGADGGPPDEVRLATPDRYQLVEVLGRGGMGVVWKARDVVLDRVVALKVLHDRFGASGHQQRLADEARAMARLNHPNVVVVYDVGARDGRTYLTMELIVGQTMSRWLDGARPWPEVVAAFRAAGEGVAAAHAAGIVHRDLKPSNILIGDDGRVRVADFGVADARDPAELAGDIVLADTASTSGTPAYMAPERFRGAAADARSDQFSFAASLYEALHGRRPFEAPTVAALIEALHGPAPAPVREVPAWLTRIVNRGLARDPADRFPSMAAMVGALSRRRRGWWIAGAAVVAAGAAAIAVAVSAGDPCGDPRRALAGVWDDGVQRRLAVATSPALAADLARHADAWAAARSEVCRAAHIYGELDATAQDRATACLDGRRRTLQAVVEELATTDPRIAAVAPLPAASDCVDRERLARTLGSGGDELALARAALAVGDPARAAELAGQVAHSAAMAGDGVVEVDALLVRGEALLPVRAGTAAEAMTAAVARAGGLGVPSLRLDAWVGLARAQVRLGQLETAASLIALAEAALATGVDHRREAGLAMVVGQLATAQMRHADAAAAARRARAAWSAELGAGAPAALPAGRLLIASLRALGRADEAVVEAEHQLAVAQPLGDDHLEVGRARILLGGALADRGDLARARPELERAVDIVRAAAGPSADLVAALTELGGVLARSGDRDGALARDTEALAMAGDLDLAIRDTARLVRDRALLTADRDPVRAEQLLRDALAEQIAALGPLHPEVAATKRALDEVLATIR
jgi:tRNA A-37 threonylcarbamoyl transferase component Bud32/tetratricopeptide (TPR) repeat protein